MTDEHETVIIDGDYRRDTDRAILINDGDQDVWLPKSQIITVWDFRGKEIEVDSLHPGHVISVEIPRWLGEAKELV